MSIILPSAISLTNDDHQPLLVSKTLPTRGMDFFSITRYDATKWSPQKDNNRIKSIQYFSSKENKILELCLEDSTHVTEFELLNSVWRYILQISQASVLVSRDADMIFLYQRTLHLFRKMKPLGIGKNFYQTSTYFSISDDFVVKATKILHIAPPASMRSVSEMASWYASTSIKQDSYRLVRIDKVGVQPILLKSSKPSFLKGIRKALKIK